MPDRREAKGSASGGNFNPADGLELATVFTVALSAERFSNQDPTGAEVNIESALAIAEGQVAYRYVCTCSCVAEKPENLKVADLSTTVVVAYTIINSEVTPPQEALIAYADTALVGVASPYIREAIQSLSLRVGLAAIVLGAFTPGSDVPASVTQLTANTVL